MGFTLIEILVTLTILATFAAGLVLTLNPKEQIDKAQNASTINNLKELKNAIALYYEDHKCYPAQSSTFTQTLATGGKWQEGGVVYMQQVPDSENGSVVYLTDTASSCPQWNVLFSRLASVPKSTTCPLVDFPGTCTPSDYSSDSDHPYACALSGAVNCQFISNETTLASAYAAGTTYVTPTTASQGGASNPTPTTASQGGASNPTPTTAPTSTPIPVISQPPGGQTWYDTSPALPDMKSGYIMPYPYSGISYTPPALGSYQYFDVVIDNPTSPVTSVEALVVNDTTDMTSQATEDATAIRFQLSLQSGTTTSGTWGGLWEVVYQLDIRYKIIVIATDEAQNQSRVELPFFGYYQPGN